jgi:hypothetical protein
MGNLAMALESAGLPREVALEQAQAAYNQQQQQFATQMGLQTLPWQLEPMTIGSKSYMTPGGWDIIGGIGKGLSPSGLLGG